MGLQVIVFPSLSEPYRRHVFIPGTDQPLLISLDTAHRHAGLRSIASPRHRQVSYFDSQLVVAVPPWFETWTTDQEMRSHSPDEETFCLFEGYYHQGSVRYGIMGQFLRATFQSSVVHPHSDRHRAVLTPCYAYRPHHPACPGVYEDLCPVFGDCMLWSNQTPRNRLEQAVTIAPGVFHELQCDTIALNIVCLHPLPEPYRVHNVPRAHTERYKLACLEPTAA